MNRKIIICLLATAVLTTVSIADAQQPGKTYRIGHLATGSAPANLEPFRLGMHKLGYREGQNMIIESRFAEGKLDRLPHLAAELAYIKVDVILATSTPAAVAAKHTTKTVPIVFTSVADPTGSDLVTSLSKPEGNITGFSTMNAGLSAKRLELIKEAVPKVSRVAVLLQPDAHGATTNKNMLNEAEDTARALGVQLQLFEIRDLNDVDKAFPAMRKQGAHALFVFPRPAGTTGRKTIVELAAKHKLPAMYPQREYVDEGGLMSYATNFADQTQRAATYVDKILKGAKPTDLPVELPKKFEFIINLETAKQIGLTIPPNVLARADRVIK